MVPDQQSDSSSVPREVAVRFPSVRGDVTLAGTLAVPRGSRAAAAVVLVSGTGPIDRDVTFAGHALFRTLADALAARGVASLRFDKRGVGESEGDFSSATAGDFVADVLGASDYLVAHEGFAAEHIGLLGHSEGGMVALTAAARAPRTAFCVSLAGPLLSGRDNAVRSFALLARGSVQRDSEYERYVMEMDTLLAIARSRAPSGRAREANELAARLAPLIINERTRLILGAKRLSGPEFFRLLSSPCLDVALGWEPRQVVPLVTCPVLIVYGAMDVQAPGRENMAAAGALVREFGKSDWTVREIAGMNHAFQRCETGMPDEYTSIRHVMADEVVEEVAAWILARTRG